MSASISPAQTVTTKQHVPAWKRIGLKLKYAKDTAEESTLGREQPVQESLGRDPEPKAFKRHRSEDGESGQSPNLAKKRKTLAESAREDEPQTTKPPLTSTTSVPAQITPAVPAVRGTGEADPAQRGRHTKLTTEHESAQTTPQQEKSGRPAATIRRKSVAFTPDTKADDGFSAQRIFKEGPSDEPPHSAAQEPEPASPSISKSTKKEKKRSKQQQLSSGSEASPTVQTAQPSEKPEIKEDPEYVRYLQQYHLDKANWKFNKNKQKDLLKNLFNVYRIAPEHDQALLAYIAGLQGAAAQRRIIEDAEDVLKKLLEKQERGAEIGGMDSLAARKAAYGTALQREIDKVERSGAGRSEYDEQQLQEIRRDIEQAKRAEAVLAELLTRELGATTSQQNSSVGQSQSTRTSFMDAVPATTTVEASTPITKPKRKKRKTRTEVSSSESSSSSSESEGE
ncbi:hypothetical protein LTR36_009265 [Oleoguttula mirabilis]|uniref:WKF domain-containing protein n=1 Tax=Oleoguttula mirabilis TaxID=1507867 RepID=A0AAV9J6U0_9PEZI|nr:hypothetical protein LTR36_009265 [Oleoguttula mirabilis]